VTLSSDARRLRPEGWRPSARPAVSGPLHDVPHRAAGPSVLDHAAGRHRGVA